MNRREAMVALAGAVSALELAAKKKVVTVSVTPDTANCGPSGKVQFTATVTGTQNTAVTWTASRGTISSTGLYTAPATIAATSSAVVRATSQADTDVSASATVQLVPPPPPPPPPPPDDTWFPSTWTSSGWDTSKAKIIAAGMSAQAAFDAAQPGDILLFQAGATWVGNFTLRVKTGTTPIIIGSTAWQSLPPVGKRITPAHAAHMPHFKSPNGMAAISTDFAAHHYRLYGLHVDSAAYSGSALRVGPVDHSGTAITEATSVAQLPHHFDIVQCYVPGHPTLGGKRGIQVNGEYVTVRDCYVNNWISDGQDTQAINGWSCRWVYIVNNYLEASGENVFFGEYSQIPGYWPSDIVVTRNYLFKPLSWRGAMMPGKTASPLIVIKNLFELKSGVRVHVHGNVLENCWSQGQKGYAFNIKSGTEAKVNPPKTEDVLIERNLIRNVEMAANVNGYQVQIDPAVPAGTCRDVTFRHNAFCDMNITQWVIQHAGGPVNDVTWERNSFIPRALVARQLMYITPPPTSGAMAGVLSSGLKFEGNLAPFGTGVKTDSIVAGTASLTATYGSAWSFLGNVLVNGTGMANAAHPAGNTYDAAVVFGADGYSQTEHPTAGCDAAAVTAATAGVVAG